jgi:hypothetical protein
VGAEKLTECSGVEEWNIATDNNDIALEIVEGGKSKFNSATGSRNVVLVDNDNSVSESSDRGRHVIPLVSHNRDNVLRVKSGCRGKNVSNKRNAREWVKNFGERGPHPSAFASGENHHGESGIGHDPIVALRGRERGRAPRKSLIRAE